MCRQGFSGGLHREVVEKLDLDELLEDGLGASHLPLPQEHLAHEVATPKLASRFSMPCDKSSGWHNPKAGSRGMLHLVENPPPEDVTWALPPSLRYRKQGTQVSLCLCRH